MYRLLGSGGFAVAGPSITVFCASSSLLLAEVGVSVRITLYETIGEAAGLPLVTADLVCDPPALVAAA